MDTLYYGTMLIGVAWLALWAVFPPDAARRYWWPFDIREPPEAAKPAAETPAPTRRAEKAKGWRRDPAPPPEAPPPAAPPSSTRPWRERATFTGRRGDGHGR